MPGCRTCYRITDCNCVVRGLTEDDCETARLNGMRANMDEATGELLARRAGLDKALERFPEDVRAAAEQASAAVARLVARLEGIAVGCGGVAMFDDYDRSFGFP